MIPFKDYYDTINWMFQQLPMYQRKGKQAFKKDLTNIVEITDKIGNPQTKIQSIHIAGTNGKGTTSHILAAMLQSNGLRVGMYTSPHYLDFRERIKINGEFISEIEVINFMNNHFDLISEVKPSFFEITVAMAFNYFKEQQVDVAIIETGLGGRLDSTNIITPIISVITNISLDHESMLGDTLAKIAYEKAGIIKNDVPVIIGEKDPECNIVFENKTKEEGSAIYYAQEEYSIVELTCKGEYEVIDLRSKEIYLIKLDIQGPFQSRNILTALSTFMHIVKLDPFLSNTLAWNKGINGLSKIKSTTCYIGRWVVVNEKPKIIGDSAHNLAGIQIVLDAIQKMSYSDLHIVLGMVNDKSIDRILKLFPIDAKYYFSTPNIPRGLNSKILKKKANLIGLNGNCYPSLETAYDRAYSNATNSDLIFFGGSTFVVAEVLSFINKKTK